MNGSDGRVDLLAVTIEADTHGRGTVATSLATAYPDDVSVNGARNAVDKLDVELGQSVF